MVDVEMAGSSEQGGIADAVRDLPALNPRRPAVIEEASDRAFERRRKLAHMLPGLIPFVMLAVYHEDPLPLWNLAVVVGVVSVLIWIWYRRREGIARSDERWAVTCMAYPIAPTVTLCLFPHRAEFAGVALIVVAFGDAAAGLGGRALGRMRLPWNPRKTWFGLACFLAAAAPLAALLYWAEAGPPVGLIEAAVCASCAALCGAVAESLPLRSLDNLRVGFAAAIGVAASHAVFFNAVS
jgi:dolichol kinase